MTERCVSLEFILYHRSLDPSIKNHKTTSFQILYTRQKVEVGVGWLLRGITDDNAIW